MHFNPRAILYSQQCNPLSACVCVIHRLLKCNLLQTCILAAKNVQMHEPNRRDATRRKRIDSRQRNRVDWRGDISLPIFSHPRVLVREYESSCRNELIMPRSVLSSLLCPNRMKGDAALRRATTDLLVLPVSSVSFRFCIIRRRDIFPSAADVCMLVYTICRVANWNKSPSLSVARFYTTCKQVSGTARLFSSIRDDSSSPRGLQFNATSECSLAIAISRAFKKSAKFSLAYYCIAIKRFE